MIAPPLPVLLPDDATAAARFEDLLELRARAAARGYRALAEAYTERIVDELSLSVSGGSRHADPPRVGARPRTGLVTRDGGKWPRPLARGSTVRGRNNGLPSCTTGSAARRLVVSVGALNPIQLAAGNVGAGAGQLLIIDELSTCPDGSDGPGHGIAS